MSQLAANNIWTYSNFTISEYEELTSTNDLSLELAKKYQIGNNNIIIAKKQINGHGRYGRSWESKSGNLFFSLTLIPKKQIKNPALLSFVSAISLSKSINDLSLNNSINILHKWPNDVLVNNKKIAGILLKSDISSQKDQIIVIGIGINLNSNPKNSNFISTNLFQENIEYNNYKEILIKFLDHFSKFYDKFNNFGFEPIRNLWLQNSFKLIKSYPLYSDSCVFRFDCKSTK